MLKKTRNYHFKIWLSGINYNFWKSLITKENRRDEFENLLVRIVGHTPCFLIFILARSQTIFPFEKWTFFEEKQKKSVISWKIHFIFPKYYFNITHYKMKGESQIHMIFCENPKISSSFHKIKSILDWKNTMDNLGPKLSSVKRNLHGQ